MGQTEPFLMYLFSYPTSSTLSVVATQLTMVVDLEPSRLNLPDPPTPPTFLTNLTYLDPPDLPQKGDVNHRDGNIPPELWMLFQFSKLRI